MNILRVAKGVGGYIAGSDNGEHLPNDMPTSTCAVFPTGWVSLGRPRMLSRSAGTSQAQRVEALLQRISDGALIEERQDAIAELRDTLHANPEVLWKSPFTARTCTMGTDTMHAASTHA